MSASLFLVRHGETEGQSSIRYHGRTDVLLSDLGRAQMRAVADAVTAERFDYVFASTLCRAVEGARLIAGNGAVIVTLDHFAEVDFGLFEGRTAEEIRDRYPDEFARWNQSRLDTDYTYPGGESRAAFGARVKQGLERMLELWARTEAPQGSALVVAHRGVIRTIVHELTGLEPIVELASIQILEHGSKWRVRQLDITSHLDGLEIHAARS